LGASQPLPLKFAVIMKDCQLYRVTASNWLDGKTPARSGVLAALKSLCDNCRF